MSLKELWVEWLMLDLDVVFACLSCQHTLRLITVTLSLSILLVSVLYTDLLVHEILSVHVRDRIIGSVEVCERDKSVALGQVRIIACNLDELLSLIHI